MLGGACVPVIRERITLQDVRNAKPEMIFYGALTPWWTHDRNDLCLLPSGIPCDPLGGVLMQTDKVEEFLEAAEKNPGHYGRHGLRAFMAAHNDNCVLSHQDPRPACFRSWEQYNDALDALDWSMRG